MNICIYGASSSQIAPRYIEAVEHLGEMMGARGHMLIFGGGAQGLMGAAARGMQRSGGKIVGVAPRFFQADGVLFENCSEFIYTDTMRERKQIMETRADGIVMTPGGIGTLEEFFEILTLKQLGRHRKPFAVLNLEGYFDEMERMLARAVRERFMGEDTLRLYRSFTQPAPLLAYLEAGDAEEIPLERLKTI